MEYLKEQLYLLELPNRLVKVQEQLHPLQRLDHVGLVQVKQLHLPQVSNHVGLSIVNKQLHHLQGLIHAGLGGGQRRRRQYVPKLQISIKNSKTPFSGRLCPRFLTKQSLTHPSFQKTQNKILSCDEFFSK